MLFQCCVGKAGIPAGLRGKKTMKHIMCAIVGLLAVVATTNPSQAGYGNGSLVGCYSYLEHTTDVPNHFLPPLPLVGDGEESVGVVCFNGGPTVVSDGYENVVNGVAAPLNFAAPGSYTITASGIGRAHILPPGNFGIVLNGPGLPSVVSSFQFMKLNPLLPELIVGGMAYYQQTYPAASYTAAVLSGCYSWLEEGISIAPTPIRNGKDELSRFCFTPGTGQSGTVTQNGWTDVNGTIVEVPTTTFSGTYTVEPLASQPPYYGMGYIQFPGGRTYEFAVNNVTGTCPACTASGFQFTQIGDVPPTNRKITGGTAFLQQ
jgi:hypothetical protein